MTALQSFVVSIVLASTSLVSIEGYPTFQRRIPNGNRVPSPCNRSIIWPGVGHRNSGGGGPRNPFGLDFAANGFVWNAALCNKDSDGDGMTNGYELGDPDCRWTVNATPSGAARYHPGICEPLDKPECITGNSWLMNCRPPPPTPLPSPRSPSPPPSPPPATPPPEAPPATEFDCSAIKESEVKAYDARLPRSPIPVRATTYICHLFQMPSDTVSDVIAFEPIVDNVELVHHMIIFACDDQPPPGRQIGETFYCGMAPSASCMSAVGLWGVGLPGQCIDQRLGFRIGPGGHLYGVLQVHWNNHELMSGQTDSSGMRIYYTSKLRPNRGNILAVGQEYLEIPANTPNVAFSGGCSSGCTKLLSQPFYISASFPHMHLLGKSQNIAQYRDGSLLRTIQDVRSFDFNTPTVDNFPDLIAVQPGDEIRVTCVYDSTGRTNTTLFGEGTYDEMCYAFFFYYPSSSSLQFCTKWKAIEVCDKANYIYPSCNITMFLQLVNVVSANCAGLCNHATCANAMKSIHATGCTSIPDVIQFLSDFYFPRMLFSSSTTFFECLEAVPSLTPTGTNVTEDTSKACGKNAAKYDTIKLANGAITIQVKNEVVVKVGP